MKKRIQTDMTSEVIHNLVRKISYSDCFGETMIKYALNQDITISVNAGKHILDTLYSKVDELEPLRSYASNIIFEYNNQNYK